MRALGFLVFSVVSAAASMGLACQQEAQIIARVANVQKMSSAACQVTVDSIKLFDSSYACPLVIGEIGSGIQVSTNSNLECSFSVGDVISGVLFRNAEGIVTLE